MKRRNFFASMLGSISCIPGFSSIASVVPGSSQISRKEFHDQFFKNSNAIALSFGSADNRLYSNSRVEHKDESMKFTKLRCRLAFAIWNPALTHVELEGIHVDDGSSPFISLEIGHSAAVYKQDGDYDWQNLDNFVDFKSEHCPLRDANWRMFTQIIKDFQSRGSAETGNPLQIQALNWIRSIEVGSLKLDRTNFYSWQHVVNGKPGLDYGVQAFFIGQSLHYKVDIEYRGISEKPKICCFMSEPDTSKMDFMGGYEELSPKSRSTVEDWISGQEKWYLERREDARESMNDNTASDVLS